MDYGNDSYYTTSSSVDTGAALAIGFGFLMFMLVIFVLTYILISICYAKIFKKAGEEGWKGWIPFYNTWTLYEIAGRPGWWVFLNFIPFVGIVFTIIALVDLVKSFGKDAAYSLLLILLPIIGFPMLAFGDSRYVGPAGPEGRPNWNPNQGQPIVNGQFPDQPDAPQPPVL